MTIAASCVALPDGRAADAAAPGSGLATAAWKLETIELTDGRRLEGLVVGQDDDDGVAFVQVVRRPGRPMFLVTWGEIDARRIRSVTRLPAKEHAALAGRVEAFRGRRDAIRAAETAVALTRTSEDAPWRYAGEWFTLDSTMDARLTREAVIRLEQVFQALESLVPRSSKRPASEPRQVHVRLCGSGAEYRKEQDRLGIRVEHPAFYVPAHALLVAGSDMPAIMDREQLAADDLALAERSLAERDREFAGSLRSLANDLEAQGVPTTRRAEMVNLARSRWEREKAEQLGQITAARRDNAAHVAAARRSFYGWLAHEAWHGYADTSLGHRLPIWLDEGLAQVIETAPLELGELRLDAPDAERLAALQDMLRDGRGPPLASVITAPTEQFQAGQATAAEARAAYLVAWGLAFHVALVEPVLTPSALAAVGDTGEATSGTIAAFEAFVGRPLDAFEPEWRRAMLALRPRTSVTAPPPVR